mmetsp:Transcript_19428/g.56624  ORF Transcript_19428/g.56624 Transcript_19428/m.56624 type:complete len:229 (+) Transcript_19428:649-1335(+)
MEVVLPVAADVHLLGLIVPNAEEDRPSAVCLSHVIFSSLPVLGELDHIATDHDNRLSLVGSRLDSTGRVVDFPDLFAQADALLVDARDESDETRKRDGDEGGSTGGAVHLQRCVVGEGRVSKVESAKLEQVARGRSGPPSPKHGARHADQLGEHVHLLHLELPAVEITGWAHSIAETLSNALHFCDEPRRKKGFLDVVNDAEGLVDGRGSQLGGLHLEDGCQPCWKHG